MAGGISTDQTENDPETANVQDEVESGGARCARYADIAVELGYCGREKVDEGLRDFLESGADAQEFGSYLVEKGVITREQSRACERGMRGHSTIGGFSILEKVGQGGMGTVFRARQISMDRIVAVKILAPKYGKDPSFKERFLQEARTCAKLSHLNIINGIDCGEDSGYAYFAMEFVDGRTVKQILKEKQRLEPDEAFKIIRQIADALSYARKLDMVHRDIKPDNIMLTQSSTAKLCDLGLAMQSMQTEPGEQNEAVEEQVSQAPASDGQSTENGSGQQNGAEKPKKKGKLALGTPHYMSPEQARGESNIDARSDIYSLGATFYHLISGKTMFEGKSSTEIMTHQVVSEAPNPCTLDPKIPAGVGAVISKMTAKVPADRYANADELIADLDAVKNGQVPAAATFIAKSSCAILPPNELRRLREGGAGWKRMIPHMAAAVVLGVLAYFGITSLGNRNQGHVSVTTTPNQSKDLVPSPTQSTDTTKPQPTTTDTTATKPPDKVPDPPVVVPPVPPDPTVKKPPEVVTPPDPNTAKVPTPPVPPVVVEPPPPPPPPVPELPRPELKLTPDILYARFLNEFESRAGRLEASKLYAEMKEISQAPAYSIAKEDITAELADLKAGWDFESKTLKRIAEQKGEVDFPADVRKKWDVEKGKAMGFDETRGLRVEIPNGVAFYITPSNLAADTVLDKSADKSPLARTQYNYVRGNKPGVFALLPSLSQTEQKRWERKFGLGSVKELELTAAEAYKNLTMIAEAKSWKTFSEMVVDFLKDYSSTPTFRKNAAQIRQWQEAALVAMAPPSKYRSIFRAATVRDIPDRRGGEPMVELIYDFKTPEQAFDFACVHGKLRVENGQLIVPEGGGEFANVRLVPPFTSIESFKAEGKTLHGEMRPFGVVFIEAAQAVTGPGQGNPHLKLNPENKYAQLEHMAEAKQAFEGPQPTFNWLKPTKISFSHYVGDHAWKVDDKAIGVAKIPKQYAGGWIALYGTGGNMAWTRIEILFKPDDFWLKMMKPREK